MKKQEAERVEQEEKRKHDLLGSTLQTNELENIAKSLLKDGFSVKETQDILSVLRKEQVFLSISPLATS